MQSTIQEQLSNTELLKLQKRFQTDPVFFNDTVLGGSIWGKQKEIMESVRDHRNTIVKSGHGVGKTHITAKVALWWLLSFYPAKVITTAPTWTQVENVLWKEIGAIYGRAKLPLGGRLKRTGLDLEDEDWFAIGLSTDESERFQGFHSPNLLVLFDEAPGIKPIIWEAAQGLMTGEHNHFLGIGNPISPSGPFFEAFRNPLYNKIHISCKDTPNYKEGKEVVPGLTTRQWVEDRLKEWGEHSPLFMSRALGEFPIEGANTLIPLSWCIDACNRKAEHIERNSYMGVDVARYGDNATVITLFQPPLVTQWRLQSKNTMEIANYVIQLFNEHRPNVICVDDTGVGGGVTDRLQELRIPTVGINFSESAQNNSKFRGVRDEMYWETREIFRTGKIILDKDKHQKMINQLSAIQYKINDSNGRIKIESKEELKKRGLPSPDDADSLVLAVYGAQKLWRMAGPRNVEIHRPKIEVGQEYY